MVYSNEMDVLLAHDVHGDQKFICVTHYLCMGLKIGNYRANGPNFVIA
jgi:hypothetical protein